MSFQSQPPKHPLENPAAPPKPVHPLEQPPPPSPAPQPGMPIVRRVEVPRAVPVLSYVILGINVVVFLVDMLSGWRLTELGAKDNQAILNGEFWRLITPMFLHGGLAHLAINSYSLYIIGPQVERSFGRWRFAAIYLLSGVAASIASFVLTPYPSIGASGALFGLIGALIPFFYHNRHVLANTRQRINSVIGVIAVNLLFGFVFNLGEGVTGVGIDNWAHIGGLLGGLGLAWMTAPRYAIRLSTLDMVRIEDESSLQVIWFTYCLTALALGGLAFALVLLRWTPIAP